ncbi:HAMP domain-containing sensor histidine kinase [Bacillus gobiensis]|uniref:sensor histidine kinase n=1 Tax=Bacillus gobiensis TaxID=1441095 RepID=UPI003D1F0582
MRVRRFGASIIGLVCASIFWLLANVIVSQLGEWLSISMNKYVEQIGSLWLMFLLMGLTIFIISRSARHEQLKIWNQMSDTIKRIAAGDFSAKIQSDSKDMKNSSHPVTKLVNQINHLAVELNEMEKIKQEFISNVSHEFQTPLTSLKGFAHLLKNPDISEENRIYYLSIIEAETMRLSKMSENLLKLTALEQQVEPIEKARFSLDKQLRRIILLCEPHWTEKNIEIDLDTSPVNIDGDEGLLNQVWTNIIHNAIKFTKEGGVIAVQVKQAPAHFMVEIKDDGIGMKEDQVQRVFERFYKADKSRNAGGSGLGLSIVQKIIELYEGQVEVESEYGRGTLFRVKLPKVDEIE